MRLASTISPTVAPGTAAAMISCSLMKTCIVRSLLGRGAAEQRRHAFRAPGEVAVQPRGLDRERRHVVALEVLLAEREHLRQHVGVRVHPAVLLDRAIEDLELAAEARELVEARLLGARELREPPGVR